MRLLTTVPHGSIPFDDEHPGGVDAREVLACGRDDRVEPALRLRGDYAGARFGAGAKRRIGLDHHDVPARELERRGMDPREGELEHAARTLTQQFDDLQRGGGGEGWWKTTHGTLDT
jgi:hypothetical protein